MKLRNSECVKWTLVLLVVLFCPYFVSSRPQDSTSTLVVTPSSSVQLDARYSNSKEEGKSIPSNSNVQTVESTNNGRDVKTKPPAIGESIKMVTSQLLDKQSNKSIETAILSDTRVPPKLKNQLNNKHKIKTRKENGDDQEEKFHEGVAVPVSADDLENKTEPESSTSNEGITTWVLLSSPNNTDTLSSTTETTKAQETQKKQKPVTDKKNKPHNKPSATKRPIISSNKADLIASGSAINENIFNKLKDTVLTNVQKNKSTSKRAATTTTTTTTTIAPSSTETLTTKRKGITKIPTSVLPVVKVTSKPKKKNSSKRKTTTSTTLAPEASDLAVLPTEAKEQEIELEISTPATTTKKPKRKKNKTKKRKTTKPSTEKVSEITEIKTSNKTKTKTKTKTSKKPSTAASPITSQIYSYFSREVMPTVGVGVIGLAGLVGLASYFFYPFSTPVRRTFEVDKKDDLYRHNAEEYASEGNGQAEEEMLGTVLAGMPAHAKHKLNPYAGQTSQMNRYSLKKEQDLRYRHVTPKYEPNYNVRYPQQKTGIAHGAVYPEPVNYTPQQYETRHVYTTESKYAYDRPGYTSYSNVEPIYAAPQTGSEVSSYGNDSPSSVVYGVKPSSDTDFKPVYPYDTQSYNSETTSAPVTYAPVTYAPTSMYLGSDNEGDNTDDNRYIDESDINADIDKFVVGNVPKELSDTATPAVVPEHGPRNLSRKKRSVKNKRSITQSIEEILRQTKDKNTDIFISNEIDDALSYSTRNLAPFTEPMPILDDISTTAKENDPKEKTTEIANTETLKSEIVESVSTLPLEKHTPTTVPDILNEVEVTTKAFKIYEVFTAPDQSTAIKDDKRIVDLATPSHSSNTETTTEIKSDSISTNSPSTAPISDSKIPISNQNPTYYPEVITYPPLNQDGGFFTFLKRLIEFKYRLGLSILQSTSEQLNRYLRNAESTMQRVAKASKDSKQ